MHDYLGSIILSFIITFQFFILILFLILFLWDPSMCTYQGALATNGRLECAYSRQPWSFLSFLVGCSHPSLHLGGSAYMSAVNCTHIIIYQLKVNRLSKNLIKKGGLALLIKLGLTLIFKCLQHDNKNK